MANLQGTVERITYYNEENGFTVAKLAVKGDKDLVTVVGYFSSIEVGEVLKLSGTWQLHKDYGYQFKTENYETVLPSTAREIENYLASGVIRGIGPATARKIVQKFEDKTLDILNDSPQELLKVPGIGNKKLEIIMKSYEEQRDTREIMLFLQQFGIGPSVAVKVYKNYKDKSIQILKENPYRMADEVYGIGFKTADSIARKMGIAQDSLNRLCAGLKYALYKAADEGHVFLPLEELLHKSSLLLEVEIQLLNEAVSVLEEKGDIVVEREWGSAEIYLPPFYHSETAIARRLFLLGNMVDKPLDIDDEMIQKIAKTCGIKLANSQKEALERAARCGVLVITGGPGTGKTTTIKSLIEFFKIHNLSVGLAAPTGRAAKRMFEATGMKAKTIHRMLGYKAYKNEGMAFEKNRDNPLKEDVVIIDEMSMVDIILMHHLLSAVRPGSRLILVGDKDQLPSVGPGSVLKEIIESRKIPVVVLSEIFRQAKQSMIVVNAHRINKGYFPYLNIKDRDFYFEQALEPEEVLEKILDLVKKRLPKYGDFNPMEDIQVLSPMKKGLLGVDNLNDRLQSVLNPPHKKKREFRYRQNIFREGDKVIQIKNNYEKEVFNGDLGSIARIDEEDRIIVEFSDFDKKRKVVYQGIDLEEISLAYALSVHKSQGSEFPVVVIPMTTQHYVMLKRNLLYTAVTRAKKLLVLVGSKQALTISVRSDSSFKRYGHLSDRIIKEFS